MTIKKQFFFLGTAIVFIPILCLLYIFIQGYIRDSDRVMLNDYKEVRKTDNSILTETDWDELEAFIKRLPMDVEAVLYADDGNILISSIPELKRNHRFTSKELIDLIDTTSENYYYQFTSAPFESKHFMLCSRVPREKRSFRKRHQLLSSSILFMFSIVFLLIIYLILIFISISKSITNLTEKTHKIADGNLEEKLLSKTSTVNTNEITSITESLEKMRLSLIEAQQQKNKFIMGISHDLRTPVAIIKGYTEALSDEVITEPEEVHNTLELISTKTTQLEGMIDTLINFMKLNNHEIRNTMCPQSITEYISTFSKEAQVTGTAFKRKIICDINFSKNIEIPFDAQLVGRVFENLMSNALRYTKINDTISLYAENSPEAVIFKISDTGCGIEEKDLNRIFDLFYRGTNSRQEEGMGIGLSLVKNIIETHGWKISVESKVNEGSCFTITIPTNEN